MPRRNEGSNERNRRRRRLAQKSGRRASNPRPLAWEANALPTELRPRRPRDSSAGPGPCGVAGRAIYRSPCPMRRLLAPVPIAVIGVVVAIVALLAYGLASNEPDRGIEEALQRGAREEAPELVLPRLSGEGEESLEDYRGQVVVLNFWASWCEPCREESPLLQRWHERLEKRGATVLGVDAFDEIGAARAFVDRYGLTYPMLKDKDAEGMELFGVARYPETFAIDRRGRIAAAQRGPVDEEWMRANVVPLLEES